MIFLGVQALLVLMTALFCAVIYSWIFDQVVANARKVRVACFLFVRDLRLFLLGFVARFVLAKKVCKIRPFFVISLIFNLLLN